MAKNKKYSPTSRVDGDSNQWLLAILITLPIYLMLNFIHKLVKKLYEYVK